MGENKGKLLVCVNDSPHARVAVKFAASKAVKRSCNMDILHIIDASDYQSFLFTTGKAREEKMHDATRLIDSMYEQAFAFCGVNAGKIIKEGEIGEKIMEAIEEDINTSMIILGAAPNAQGNTRRLINWLTTQVGTRLLIPFLILPGNLTDQQIDELS